MHGPGPGNYSFLRGLPLIQVQLYYAHDAVQINNLNLTVLQAQCDPTQKSITWTSKIEKKTNQVTWIIFANVCVCVCLFWRSNICPRQIHFRQLNTNWTGQWVLYGKHIHIHNVYNMLYVQLDVDLFIVCGHIIANVYLVVLVVV